MRALVTLTKVPKGKRLEFIQGQKLEIALPESRDDLENVFFPILTALRENVYTEGCVRVSRESSKLRSANIFWHTTRKFNPARHLVGSLTW